MMYSALSRMDHGFSVSCLTQLHLVRYEQRMCLESVSPSSKNLYHLKLDMDKSLEVNNIVYCDLASCISFYSVDVT